MSTTAVLRGARSAIARVEAACDADLAPRALLEVVVDELDRAMPVDALFISATDPETMLGLGAGVVRGMPEDLCDPFWAYEIEVPDFNKFVDLARSEPAVADLHTVTGGRPERSARWREVQAYGDDFHAELRGTFNAGGGGWGMLHLNRGEVHGGFTPAEVGFVAELAPRVGRALRRSTVTHTCQVGRSLGPGMAVLDERNQLVSITPAAIDWLERVETYGRRAAVEFGIQMPWEVLHAAQLARSRTARQPSGAATRARLRTACGAWLLVHASALEGPGGTEQVAIVIEPAKASEVAPLIVEAYELTPRELDVTRALARGLSTMEIAQELFLSRYTVQDHLKRVYEKVGVTTRGGLVAKMFADHYHDRMDVAHLAAA